MIKIERLLVSEFWCFFIAIILLKLPNYKKQPVIDLIESQISFTKFLLRKGVSHSLNFLKDACSSLARITDDYSYRLRLTALTKKRWKTNLDFVLLSIAWAALCITDFNTIQNYMHSPIDRKFAFVMPRGHRYQWLEQLTPKRRPRQLENSLPLVLPSNIRNLPRKRWTLSSRNKNKGKRLT